MSGRIKEVIILETSDMHGNILPINYADNRRSEHGLAKVSTLIKEERRKNSYLILIDNGDIIQGTPLAYYFARINKTSINPIIKAMNHMKYDAAVVGNHDFNYGREMLEKSMEESDFPWLSANILREDDGRPYCGRPYIIKDFDGIKVAVLGITTSYIPNWENPVHIKGIKFENPVATAEKWVKHLRENEKVDVLVVSYHGGFERDIEVGEPTEELTGENQAYEICMKLPEIDVLLTGHQHRVIEGKNVNGVLVLQPGSLGKSLGKVTLKIQNQNERWSIIEKKSEVIHVKEFQDDKEIVDLVKSYEEEVQKWLDKPIGRIKGDMRVKDPMEIRLKDNPFIEFINRVQMKCSGATISSTALFDNNAPGFPENVTMRDIVANYIYPNTLKVLRLKGKDIKEALEKSASYFETYNGGKIRVNSEFIFPKVQHYNYDMWEGIEYKINISRPSGQRVVELKYRGKPIDMEEEYDVVMNNYRATGGGNYFMFKGKPVVKDINIDMAELIANYIMEKGTIEAAVDNNWEVIHD